MYKKMTGRMMVDMRFKEKYSSQPNRKDQEQEYRPVVYQVAVPRESTAPKSTLDYDFPEYTSERARIKATSKKMAGLSISEAFTKTYGIEVHISPELEEQINQVAADLHVGDLVEMTINHIGKGGVVFESMNYKQNITTNVNLNRYPNAKSMCGTPILVKVVSVTNNKVVVDPLAPMFDQWINKIVENPDCQKVIGNPQIVTVKNLKLTNGGFVGRAVIPSLTQFLGEEYTVEAFIPGSHIVLNIENNFEQWNGKTVNAFVTNYITKPGAVGQMSLICSVKEYLKFKGDQNIISMFNQWCEGNEKWATTAATKFAGKVTGIIQSSKKCGVFVEIPMLNITGFVTTTPEQLGGYNPGKQVSVQFAGFEENTYYDPNFKQVRHELPYTIEDNILTKCSVKPVLKFAE